MKAYLASNTVPGYGPRIFIPYEFHTPEVKKVLTLYSTWGGHDKDTGKCYGYEFPSTLVHQPLDVNRFKVTKEKLAALGFILEEQSESNTSLVWV